MCQYSSIDGHPTDWHLVHLGSRAVGGAGLIMVEATAVTPEGRISPDDSGIWSDEHIPSFKKINDFLKTQGSVCAIQIAHAGRKGSTEAPWLGEKVLPNSKRGWQTIAPSAIAFSDSDPVPHEMSIQEIEKCIANFAAAAQRAYEAGFQVLELHMAHGYLVHEFLSPLSNKRRDNYGGSLENRMRFPLAVATAVRKVWPQELPLFVRISTTDWAGGPSELKNLTANVSDEAAAWDLPQSVIFCRELKKIGVDLIDCSTGGTLAHADIPVGAGYQVAFASVIRKEANIQTAAVGMITQAMQAEAILVEEQADAIFIGREILRDPYWPQRVANELRVKVDRPLQYVRS